MGKLALLPALTVMLVGRSRVKSCAGCGFAGAVIVEGASISTLIPGELLAG